METKTIRLELVIRETELTVEQARRIVSDKLGDALVGKAEELFIGANGYAGLSVDLVE